MQPRVQLRAVDETEAAAVRRLAASRTAPAGVVQRAWVIRALLEDPTRSATAAGRLAGFTREDAGPCWVRRFNAAGGSGGRRRPIPRRRRASRSQASFPLEISELGGRACRTEAADSARAAAGSLPSQAAERTAERPRPPRPERGIAYAAAECVAVGRARRASSRAARGEVIIWMTAKNTAGTTISIGSPEAATNPAAMLNSFLLTVNR